MTAGLSPTVLFYGHTPHCQVLASIQKMRNCICCVSFPFTLLLMSMQQDYFFFSSEKMSLSLPLAQASSNISTLVAIQKLKQKSFCWGFLFSCGRSLFPSWSVLKTVIAPTMPTTAKLRTEKWHFDFHFCTAVLSLQFVQQ